MCIDIYIALCELLIFYFRAFVERLLQHNIATVGVGFPATSLLTARARFCISGAHTKEMLDKVCIITWMIVFIF